MSMSRDYGPGTLNDKLHTIGPNCRWCERPLAGTKLGAVVCLVCDAPPPDPRRPIHGGRS